MRLRHVDCVTASGLDDCRLCTPGHEVLGRWGDHLVVGGDFGDHCAPRRVDYEDDGTVPRMDNAFRCYCIVGQRYRRILNDSEMVAAFGQYLVDVLPSRTVHESTVNEDDREFCRLRCS